MNTAVYAENEAFVRKAVTLGAVADFRGRDGEAFDPENKPKIRASFVRDLMLGLDRDNGAEVKPLLPGVRIRGAFIDGDLDLADCAGGAGLPALALDGCDLPNRIILTAARVARFSIRESRIRELWGDGLKVDGELNFMNAEPAPQSIGGTGIASLYLSAVRIGGDVWGTGARLVASDALNFQAAAISGTVQLNDISVQGRAWFSGATIGGSLECSGSRFINPGGEALVAENAAVRGDMLLRATSEKRFEAEGEVWLLGAKIGGDLNCGGGRFSNPEGTALTAQRADIGGALMMRAFEKFRFEAEGRVSLLGARIDGNYELDGASFTNGNDVAVGAQNAHIGGSVLMRAADKTPVEVKGQVSFLGATIAGDLELQSAKLSNKGWAFNLRTARIEGQLFAENNEVDGMVTLSAARIRRMYDNPDTAWGDPKAKTQIELNEINLDLVSAFDTWARPLWRSRARWLRRNTGEWVDGVAAPFSNQPWRQVAAAFERAGLHSDARRIRREEQREAYRHRSFASRLVAGLFGDLMFGYGLSVSRATVTAALFWALGAAGAWTMHHRGALVAVQAPDRAELTCPDFQPGLYAFDVMVPVLDLGQERACEPGRAPGAKLFAGYPVKFRHWAVFEEIALWSWAKALYGIFGAGIVGFALLTYTGVFKPRAEP